MTNTGTVLFLVSIMIVEGMALFAMYVSRAQDRRAAYRRVVNITDIISGITNVLGNESCPHCGFKHRPFPLIHVEKGDVVYFGWDVLPRTVKSIAIKGAPDTECKMWVTLKGFKQKQFPITCINR